MNFDLDRSDSTEGGQLPEDAEKVSFDSEESDIETSDDAYEYGEYGAQLAESAEEDGPEGSNEQKPGDDASKEQESGEVKPEEDAIEDSSEKKSTTDGNDEGAPQDLQKSPPTPDSADSSTGDLPKAEVKGRNRVVYSREAIIQAAKTIRDSGTAVDGIEWSISERTYPRLPKTEEGQRIGGSRDGSIPLAEMSEARSDSVPTEVVDGAERPESPKPDVVVEKVYSRDEMIRLSLACIVSAMKKVVDESPEGPTRDMNAESPKALHYQRLNEEVERVANWLKEVDLS